VTRVRRATAAAWVSVTVLSLAGVVLTVMAWGHLKTSDTAGNLTQAPSPVLYATLGALIVRRAGNTVGWFLLGIGAGLAVQTSASTYAVLGITHPGTLPAPDLVGLLAEWSFVPVVSVLVFMLLLFPSGTLPSPRWRPFAALALLATALAMAGFVVHPRLVALPVLLAPRSPCPAPIATSSSPSPTTATALTPQNPHPAPACKAWQTGWPRPAAPSTSAPRPGSAPP
jgi:hypothetical protein